MKQTIALISAMLCGALILVGQGGGGGRAKGGKGGDATAKSKAAPEEGIPVTSDLVIAKCSGCHTKDEKGNLGRISWERSSPEGWEEALKRMMRLNGLELQPAEAKSILKYLATNHGLAPEEAKPYMYIPEHRIQDEVIPTEGVRTNCMACHALGKAFQWQRSRDDWQSLANMHIAFFPQADAAFRRNAGALDGQNAAGGEGGNAQANFETTLDYLGKEHGLHTPSWAAWSARMRAPKIAGKWAVTAKYPGKGNYVGEMVIAQGPSEDEFTTTTKLTSLSGGPALSRTGIAMVYAGYSWRGRSKSATPLVNQPGDPTAEMREVMWMSPDQISGEGRWFWGEYQEFGLDVKLKRITAEPVLLTTDRLSLKTGSTAQKVRLIGVNLPAKVTPADLDFGAGVTVKSIASSSPTEIVAMVDVAPTTVLGKRDIALGITLLPGQLAIYDKVDYISVTPESSMARLGGDVHPKGYQQLAAVGFNRGQDGKLHTPDDIDLGPTDVTWSMEEFYAVFGDDDREFVGSLSNTGLFTPNLDGPNPARKFQRNNYGDVWVVATALNEKDKEGKPLTGRSYLVVTVPTYIRWDQPEVGGK